MVTKLPVWQEKLFERGILEVATDLGDWRPEKNGWSYPVYKNGRTYHRWKAFDSSANPKYLWPDGKPEGCKYYLLPGAVEAIQDSSSAFIASGEPDNLAFRAAGLPNVLSWYGEESIPDTLLEDLLAWNVLTVYLYPDRDVAGSKMANLVRKRLEPAIQVLAYELPESLGDKGDINKLWIASQFNAEIFVEVLMGCSSFAFPETLEEQARNIEHKELPAAFYEAIEREMAIKGVKRYDVDGWSNNIACIFTSHEHDKEHPAAAWNREKRIFKCFKCGENVPYLAIHVGDVLGIDWHDFIERPQQGNLPLNLPANGTQTKSRIVTTWSDATDRALDEIEGVVDDPAGEPLPMPFDDLRAFGGFAEALPARKIMAVVGDSGDGKTSLTETIVDYWRRQGFTGMMWGPEWSPVEYVYRAVQRGGGPSLMQMIHHKAWHAAAKRGVPEQKRRGKRLTKEEYEKGKTLAEGIKKWPGKLYFVERLGMPVEELIIHFKEILAGATVHGQRIDFVVCDYAQLFRASGGKANEQIDKALREVKSLCTDYHLAGVVGSQVTKEDGKASSNGGKLGQHDMMNGRGDYFNLVLSINRPVGDDGKKALDATIRLGKNSLGGLGDFTLRLDEKLMKWHGIGYNPIDLG